jgi:hypothetical protein
LVQQFSFHAAANHLKRFAINRLLLRRLLNALLLPFKNESMPGVLRIARLCFLLFRDSEFSRDPFKVSRAVALSIYIY